MLVENEDILRRLLEELRVMATAKIPVTGVTEYITRLAKKHDVQYVKTPNDALADVITNLADDDVKMDRIELLLIALERAGVIASDNVVPLHINYLREKLNVRSI